jgi:2-C-methyl-D-erythritol 2,4-cyclodiphosphate synthase
LLGAAALGDIGRHFPDSDPAYAGANSRELLRQVVALLKGYNFINADVTVIAEAPRLAPYIEEMRANLAHDLGTEVSRINVKATTTEKLGFIGREEAIAAEAVVLLEQMDQLSVEELGI